MLLNHLYEELHFANRDADLYSCWVMDPEWLTEIKRIRDSNGRGIWEYSFGKPDRLFGYPMTITRGAGTPHLI